MKNKRIKSYRRAMQLYQSSFGFRESYQLLVDAAFLQSCVKQKMDIMARLHDVLQGAVKPMITQCCIQALYDAGAEAQAAVDAAKGFERRKCNHFKARPEDECMLAMAGTENKNRYVFATQSLPLRESLRAVPGSPIIYIARSVMLLESPSNQTLAKKRRMEESKLHVSAEELAVITGKPLPSADPVAATSAPPADPSAAASEGAAEPPKKKKRKGPSGPNPLSVKKKKAKPADPSAGRRPSKREREEDGGDLREQKRQREEDGKVVSLAARGDGGEKKKRRRRRKGATTGADGEGGNAGEGGAGSGGEA